MPIVLALVASAVIHAAALLGPGWTLPGDGDADAPQTIDAVLTRPAPRPEATPVAKSVPKPHVDKPRPQRMATAASAAPSISSSPSESSAPPTASPVEPPPVAVAPAPTFESAPVPARIALPAKGRVRYAITRGEEGFVIGQTTHTWQQDGFTYTLQSVAETTGLVALFKSARVLQISRGEVTAAGLRPHEFRHERVGGLDTANFDWARGVVAYAGREDGVSAGTQDMLSMYYQLVLLAPQSGVVEMPIATGRKLEIFRLEVLGEVSLALPGGERRALHVRTRSSNDTIELWLRTGADAASRGLPLKIRFIDRRGDIFDQIADDLDSAESK